MRLVIALSLTLASSMASAMSDEFFEALMQIQNDKKGEWNYRETKNKMTDEVTATAAILETYGGRIEVENSSQGVSTFVTLKELACPERCVMLVRADDTAPQSFPVVKVFKEFNDYYFADPAAFLRYVKGAHRILVQPPTKTASNAGQRPTVVEFRTSTPLVIRPLRTGIRTQ